jgi:YD repeat-containing protein
LIYNAARAGSLVATVDAGLPGWTLSGAASSTQDARSGDRSIRFAAVGQSAKTTFPGIDVNRTHQVSFWIKSRSPNPSGGTIQLGAVQKSFAYNHQNLREWQRVSATYLPSELNGIGHVLTIASDKAAEYFVDDIRVAPEDALVFSMTYRDDGKLQSLSDEKDVISYFSYDELGRLMEVKDYQGLIRSTQAQHQAVR